VLRPADKPLLVTFSHTIATMQSLTSGVNSPLTGLKSAWQFAYILPAEYGPWGNASTVVIVSDQSGSTVGTVLFTPSIIRAAHRIRPKANLRWNASRNPPADAVST
jgi:hypothetical protein